MKTRRITIEDLARMVKKGFDGTDKNTYEKLRKGASFVQVKNNILNFLEIKRKLGLQRPITQIQIIEMKDTVKKIPQFINEWEKTDVDLVSVKKFSTRAGFATKINLATENNYYHLKNEKRKPCFWFWKGVSVLWDGKVVPCCQDLTGRLVLGDLKKQTLIKIWNSIYLQNLRKQQINKNYNNGLCNSCLEWEDGFEFSKKIHKFI